jgi:hypothetical protein
LDLPTGLPVNGFHLCIFFTTLVSGIVFMADREAWERIVDQPKTPSKVAAPRE